MSETTESRCFSWPGAAGALLRVSIGLLFLVAGLNKILGEGGPAAVSRGIIGTFEGSPLPAFLVAPYAYALPFVEAAIGAVLILGIFANAALALAGLLLLSLSFGQMVLGNHATVGTNMNYVFMAAVGLWFTARENAWSLDKCLFKRK